MAYPLFNIWYLVDCRYNQFTDNDFMEINFSNGYTQNASNIQSNISNVFVKWILMEIEIKFKYSCFYD